MGFKFECLGGPWGLCPRTIFFSEYGHVAYQSKGNKMCNMRANSLPLHTPSIPGVGSKGQNSFF